MQREVVEPGPAVGTSAPPVTVPTVASLSTSPGRPIRRVGTPHGIDDVSGASPGSRQYSSTITSRRFIAPLPQSSDPPLLSSTGYAQDLEFDEQVKELQREVEMDKERRILVAGVEMEDLNALLRAFDRYNRSGCAHPPNIHRIPHGLDLQPDPDEELSALKVRSALERLYSSAGMGFLRVIREVQRIRLWEDATRSTISLSVYVYAWWCNCIIAAFLVVASILVLVPSSRDFLFQSAPHRQHDRRDEGAVEKVVGTRTASTWGPAAAETSATRWATSVQDVMQSMAAGTTPEEEKTAKEGVKDKMECSADQEFEKLQASGMEDKDDGQRNRRELIARMYAQPGMRVVSGLADKWERMDHAIHPKSRVYNTDRRIAVFVQLLLPALVASICITEAMVSRAIGFIVGILLFAQPLTSHLLEELERTVPDWKSRLILEVNLFDTVPTNAQLVLGLLRDAERRYRPIPPPALSTKMAQDATATEDEGEEKKLANVGQDGDGDTATSKGKDAVARLSLMTDKGKDGTRAKARHAWDKLGQIKEDASGFLGFAVLAGHKKIDIQGHAERVLNRLHISQSHRLVSAALDRMPSRPPDAPYDGSSSSFYVWHKRHGPGHVVIHPHDSSSKTLARIEFSTIRRVKAEENVPVDPRRDATSGHLVISINDVIHLRKVGLSTVKRAALSWALDSERAGGTGFEITVLRKHLLDPADNAAGRALEVDEEEKIMLTSIVRRDELFNRLIALGDQRWEMV